jgi:signal transduction histidine kinase
VNTPEPSEPDESAAAPAHTFEDLTGWAERLALRSEELDRFGRVAAHDLRAPLRSIEAFTRIALETEDAEESSGHLERVLNAVGRMRRLLDSLVDFADAGDAALDVAQASLDEVVRSAIADLSVDVTESGAVIDVGRLPSVECDPTQLRRVFTNLLSNSITYTGANPPHIVIQGFEEPDRVRITVTDDGVGFSSDLTEAAFQPLHRLTSIGVGQGIGLAICRRIVDRHGGEIWAESEPGAGTTISITLPRSTTG